MYFKIHMSSEPPYSFLKVKINDLGLTPFMHDVTLDDFL